MPAVQCDQCDHCFPVTAAAAGYKVTCPNCQARVRVHGGSPPMPVPVRITHPVMKEVHSIVHLAVCFTIAACIVGLLLFGVFHFVGRY